MNKIAAIVGIVFLLASVAFGYYLLRPLAHKPTPALFHCYEIAQGTYVPLDPPPQAFGIGLSYAAHIEETASKYQVNTTPPIFRKHPRALARTGATVVLPGTNELVAAAESLEPGLGEAMRKERSELSPLLDYEVEMGFVLLDDIDPAALDDAGFAPQVGFYIANDLSARTLAILGEDQRDRFSYWGASKSFPGFMPVADRAWVPKEAKPNGIPCVVIETTINDELRQRQSTDDLIYTPVQMLRLIRTKYPNTPLQKGTFVLTGTPGGVALTTPRWLARLSHLLGLSRFTKLAAKLDGDTTRFLSPGDRVVVRGEGLGQVSVVIAEGEAGQ